MRLSGQLLLKIGIATAAVLTTVWSALPVLGEDVVKYQGYVPFTDSPIRYRSETLRDPIAKLQSRIDAGEVKLEYEPEHGYLRSVLKELKVPISSQALVFSKTSFQFPQIGPDRPRALYYNDDVYVGQVQEGKSLEFVSFDPLQGAIFYVLDEEKTDHPRFARSELDCIQCHVAASTKNVPGVMLRSVYPSPSGTQAGGTPSFFTGQESPIKDRWGGWYVTGLTGNQPNMGNAILPKGAAADSLDRVSGNNLKDLKGRLDTSAYLSGYSDVVAQLVLAHQTQMHNLITQTNYQTRLALNADDAKIKKGDLAPGTVSDATKQQIQRLAEPLIRYLLFTNEAPLTDQVTGTSGFAEEFAARGLRDSRGRSLRDFDLRKRIFKYPCSYLIYSEHFDNLPTPARDYVLHRLFEVLSGHEQGAEFASLSAGDRRAILEILVATKPNLPEEWKNFVHAEVGQSR
jgi:hypothetical protein